MLHISSIVVSEKSLEILKKNLALEFPIDTKKIKAYSLGSNLSFNEEIDSKRKEIILNLIKNMKSLDLENDMDAFSFVCGHIFNYFLSINLEPYIEFLSSCKEKVDYKDPKDIIEECINVYLLKHYLNTDYAGLNKRKVFRVKLEASTATLTNRTYKEMFNIKNMDAKYKKAYYKLSLLTISPIKKNTILKFMDINYMSINDLTNLRHKEYLDMAKRKVDYTLDDIIDKSVNEAVNMIIDFEDYLSKHTEFAALEEDLDNTSGPIKKYVYIK